MTLTLESPPRHDIALRVAPPADPVILVEEQWQAMAEREAARHATRRPCVCTPARTDLLTQPKPTLAGTILAFAAWLTLFELICWIINR